MRNLANLQTLILFYSFTTGLLLTFWQKVLNVSLDMIDHPIVTFCRSSVVNWLRSSPKIVVAEIYQREKYPATQWVSSTKNVLLFSTHSWNTKSTNNAFSLFVQKNFVIMLLHSKYSR